MTIAVTGSTGHLGRLVIEALLETVAPHDIVGIARDSARAADLVSRGVQVRVADYDAPDTLDVALHDVDRLLLVSGNNIGHRVVQHTNVVDAARRAGVKRIAYTSAPRADSTDLPVAPEHKATEAVITSSGIPYVILRNGWYNENYVELARESAANGSLYSSAHDGRVSSAARADYAEAAANVLTRSGDDNVVYELGGDTSWTFEQLAVDIATAAHRPVEYRPLSREQYRAHLLDSGVPQGAADFATAMDEATAHGGLQIDTGDLSHLIGHSTTPITSLLNEVFAAHAL